MLAEREAVVGYAPAPDRLELVMASHSPQCTLERVGDFTSDTDVYAQRHESERDFDSGTGTAPDPGRETLDEADWMCHSHSNTGPEPATELDWTPASFDEDLGVSCVVGEGIAAGWWRWHVPGGDCTYLVTQDADDPDRRQLRRRDASELLLLTEGESVWGYSESDDDRSPFTVSTSTTTCILQFIEPE